MKANLELMEELKKNNKRIGFLLSEWIGDYSFYERPDPHKAIKWLHSDYEGKGNKEAAKWFIEYNRIHDLVDMAFEYVMLSEKAIEEAQGVK